MKKLLLAAYILTFTVLNTGAQHLKGVIRDSGGDPVRYATVYINELKQGTTANIKGEYDIKLGSGEYTVFFQSLGFSPEVRNISIDRADKTLNITLSAQYYQIPEVRVTATGEDPAYRIMRKAIGLAPYHLNRVRQYQAEVYIKGSVVVNKIPRIVRRNINSGDIDIREGDSYLIESMNRIEYEAPDTYRQTVIAQQSTFPDTRETDISPLDVVKASFYQPVLADIAISPLAPNAMSHYNFSYEGSTPQGPYIVNKIKVSPKRKSQQVFEGTIYIIEDLWCIHSLDLTNENMAGSINIKQVYTPVLDDIWMPVSHSFEVKVAIVGVDADGTYGSAVTYKHVEPNEELPKPGELDLNPTAAEQEILEEQRESSKTQQKIEEILQKDEISNRDMSRLSRLMEKEAEESNPRNNELEVKASTSYKIEEDAASRGRDYWSEARPIPLSEEERRSIRVSDSLSIDSGLRRSGRQDSTARQVTMKKRSAFSRTMQAIFLGKTWRGEDSNSRFRLGGLADPANFGFNSVDGFKYSVDFNYSNTWDSEARLSLSPEIGWDFAREGINWNLSGLLTYDHMHMSRLAFWMGMGSKDFSSSAGISPFVNMVSSLLYKDNYLRLYDSRYLTVSQRSEYFNGFYVEFRYAYDDRRLLDNNTSFSLFRKEESYQENIPINTKLGAAGDEEADFILADHIHHQFSTVVSYIPRQRYRIENGKKSMVGSDYITYKLYYDHGINITGDGNYNHFDHIQFEANQDRSIGAFNEYSWRFRAGTYLKNDRLPFQDFKHFNIQSLPLLIRNHQDVFMLPDYYSLATPEYYLEAHFRYTTPYLLLKLLPFLSNSLMRENLSLAYMYSPHTGNYYELGYGLSEVFLLGKIGVFVGFEDLEYKSAGLRFTFILR